MIDYVLLVLCIVLLVVLAYFLRCCVMYQHSLHELRHQTSDDHRRFLRRLDHELKNPLTAIQVALANLETADSTEQRQRLRANIHSQVQRLSLLATSLRKLAELENVPLEESATPIADLIQDVLAVAADEDEPRDITLSIPRDKDLMVSGDRDLLHLALYNVVENALKFTEPGDKITITSWQDEGNIAVEVRDTGMGIPEEEQPYVWDELYRGKDARSVPGKGMGLSIVKAIVERHGGRVDLESEDGTTITFYLPAAD